MLSRRIANGQEHPSQLSAFAPPLGQQAPTQQGAQVLVEQRVCPGPRSGPCDSQEKQPIAGPVVMYLDRESQQHPRR